jgi:hypothetical protein
MMSDAMVFFVANFARAESGLLELGGRPAEIKNRYLVLTGLLRGSFLAGYASRGGLPPPGDRVLIEQRRD